MILSVGDTSTQVASFHIRENIVWQDLAIVILA